MDLLVDGTPVDWWGSLVLAPDPLADFATFASHTFSPSHKYWLPYVGQGASVDLSITDTYYSDNSGSLTVSIYAAGPVQVELDIKPGSYPNSINLGSNGVIPVALLSSADFDATSADPATVVLAGAGVAIRGNGNRYMSHEEDVDGDGLLDLVIQVETENLNPDEFQDGYAILTGETYDGQPFEGCDEITIVPD